MKTKTKKPYPPTMNDYQREIREAVGPCPKCGAFEDLWFNNVPMTAYCWGTEDNPHCELVRIVPNPMQIYGQVGKTEWRYGKTNRTYGEPRFKNEGEE